MSDELRLYVPIEKVDKEKRTVAGWATSEEIDKQNEIVDYSGSKDAFNNWQGNIREMHEPKAVGKAVEIIPDDENKRIWVKAYISKGAEDTWQKVQDGTLGGFSIGGQTTHKTTQIVKDLDSGGSKTVTRITKYRLNELSLVDNPANPECSFELVKSIDGVPFQTELVEDNKKVLITEAEDPLVKEVYEHRGKADALIRKTLDYNELEKLGDNDFGVVRKSQKDHVITKERLLPMPDKVHAVRALEIYKNYGLTAEEENLVHKKAEEVLGAAYDNYKNLNRGGEDKMSNEKIDKLTDTVNTLAKTVEGLIKAFEGAYRPIPGSKDHPNRKEESDEAKKSDSNPDIKESAPYDSGAVAETDTQTQPADGAVPAKAEKAANPATSNLETQETPAAPTEAKETVSKEATTIETEVSSTEDQSAPAAAHSDHPSSKEVKTQDPDGAYPSKEKGPIKQADMKVEEEKEEEEVEAKKSVTSENDIAKVESKVESLRKRFDEVFELLKQPKPRKIKIEKNLNDKSAAAESQLQKDMNTVQEWQKLGKSLSPDQERFKDQVVNKMLSEKFDS